MRVSKVESGQLWRFTDYRKREVIYIVVGPRDDQPGGWDLHAISGQNVGGAWDLENIMLSNPRAWEFLA